MLWALLILWALGFVLLWRVPACPPPIEGPAPDTLSIVIPARNEARNLPRLLASIRAQSLPPHEVLVVDDDSSDGTAALAEEGGAKVLRSAPLPEGWRGKTWACSQGATAASGRVLLFLDADTVLQPEALRRIWAAWRQTGVRALSLGPWHEVRRPYEHLSAMFNLLTFFGMGAFALYGRPDRPKGLFGPFLLIDRAAYDAAGGHAAVRGEILEHMALSPLLREQRIPQACLGGRGVVHTRMYPDGFRSLAEGWTKAFAAGASRAGSATLVLSVAWITGGMLAFLLTLSAPWSPWPFWTPAIAYAAYAAGAYWMLRRIGGFHVLAALCYPVLMLFFFVVFFRSALLRRRGATVTWKGRGIAAGPAGGRK